MTQFVDKVLTCVDCKAEFPFAAGEQEFYARMDFKSEPKRCKACRQMRTATRPERIKADVDFEQQGTSVAGTKINCSQCGKETMVPFRLRKNKPGFCRECLQERRAHAGAA